ncbi:aminotransferase class IV [Lutispora sp.]|uniref:aminotransferase class IV n=1 Tax=Lutispora sp. TaxID=2828727 RepID=UPI002B1F3501|nr:aminotransferase class IV [Lutispora sp.]MEA4963123.1 aminotransferase class IV [Lutispora sp.]
MKNEIIEKYLICNGSMIDRESYKPCNDFAANIVYEVIRVIDGVPLFLEEHMDRLVKSSEMISMDIRPLSGSIASNIKKLIEVNNKPAKNLKILVYKGDKSYIDYSIFFIQSNYPQPELYEKGIKAILFNALRENPNAKVQNSGLRERVNKALSESSAYEALLVNEAGEITEGSKSNVFFVKNNSLYTSPKQEVLLGVTRTRVIELARSLGIETIEASIHKSFLEKCDGLFITGTSPKVLPISNVDEFNYESSKNETILSLMKAYDSLIEAYIKRHKN